MGFPNLDEILARLIILLIALPVHEWAHAWSAWELGDDTAAMRGRLSLNPLAHLDIYGSVLLLLTGFGWAKPVPVNPYRMRRVAPRTGMAITAFAGPASNFLIGMLCAVPFRIGVLGIVDVAVGNALASLLWTLAGISIGLGLFNLIPIYPLDGEKVLAGLLPPQWGYRLEMIRPYAPFILIALLVTGIVGTLIWPVEYLLLRMFVLW